jgi:hypothetical protein
MASERNAMTFQGKKNAYCCRACGFTFISIDRDDGTTPFLTKCEAPEVCHGTAQSSLYRIDQSLEPTHEWYKPDAVEVATIRSPAVLQHVAMGGLLMRKIEDSDD